METILSNNKLTDRLPMRGKKALSILMIDFQKGKEIRDNIQMFIYDGENEVATDSVPFGILEQFGVFKDSFTTNKGIIKITSKTARVVVVSTNNNAEFEFKLSYKLS